MYHVAIPRVPVQPVPTTRSQPQRNMIALPGSTQPLIAAFRLLATRLEPTRPCHSHQRAIFAEHPFPQVPAVLQRRAEVGSPFPAISQPPLTLTWPCTGLVSVQVNGIGTACPFFI